MICQTCKSQGEFNQFQTFQFYFCKTCKKEIDLEVVAPQVTETSEEELQRIFDELAGELSKEPDIWNTDDPIPQKQGQHGWGSDEDELHPDYLKVAEALAKGMKTYVGAKEVENLDTSKFELEIYKNTKD